MLNRRVLSSGTNTQKRGLDDAVKYCLQGWFPVSGTYLKEIQKRLKDGRYSKNRDLLLSDLREDLSLFCFVIRQLHRLAAIEGESPFVTFRKISIDKIHDILDVTEGQISAHSMNDMPKSQAFRLKHSVISTSTAALLGEKTGVEPLQAFTGAIVRQLGLNLIAWNYPSLYSKALLMQAAGESTLEKALHSLLGFSPDMLTQRVLEDWRSPPGWHSLLGRNFDKDVDIAVQQIVRCCEMGESYARVSDPEHYPSAAKEWSSLVKEIDAIMGSDGVKLINEKIEKYSVNYVALSPKVFAAELSPEKNIEAANLIFANQLFLKNTSLQKCPANVKDIFRAAYQFIKFGTVSGEAISILAARVLPAIGFEKGCIYLVDTKTSVLVPKLRIGAAHLSRYKPVGCGSGMDISSSIAEALFSGMPIREEEAPLHDEMISHISWNLGTPERGGVLHLEMSEALVREPTNESLMLFKAARQAVEDCLNLR